MTGQQSDNKIPSNRVGLGVACLNLHRGVGGSNPAHSMVVKFVFT